MDIEKLEGIMREQDDEIEKLLGEMESSITKLKGQISGWLKVIKVEIEEGRNPIIIINRLIKELEH